MTNFYKGLAVLVFLALSSLQGKVRFFITSLWSEKEENSLILVIIHDVKAKKQVFIGL